MGFPGQEIIGDSQYLMKQNVQSTPALMRSFADPWRAISSILNECGSTASVEGLHGAARALFLARAAREADRPILVITADQNSSELLMGDLNYFFGLEKVNFQPRFFPAWELLPYENLSPLNEISGERLEVLSRLMNRKCPFLVAPVEAVMQCVMPRSVLRNLSFPIKKGDALDRDILVTSLADNGYRRVNLVEDRGEFSVRGDIVDFFLPAAINPVRVEFFGDEVESLRAFDSTSQVSVKDLPEVEVLPVREVCLSPEQIKKGVEKIRSSQNALTDRSRLKELLDRIQNLDGFSGIENLAPFFYPGKETLFDYLPEDMLLVIDEKEMVLSKSEQYHELIRVEYENARERGDVVVSPEDFYLGDSQFLDALHSRRPLTLESLKLSDDSDVIHFDIKPIPPMQGKFEAFAGQVAQWEEEGMQVIILAPTKGQVRRVHELLGEYALHLNVDRGHISAGFIVPALKKVFVAEHELFGRSHKHRYRRKPKSQSFQRGFKDLKPGDFLVHIDYGIGQYIGPKELSTGGEGGEFLEIIYADDEKLYIPMQGLGYIQKYTGGGDTSPPLSKLGSVAWNRQKEKIKSSIREMAGDVLRLYAARELAKGTSYSANPILMQELSDSFEYEETEDQLKAIEEMMEDLEKEKPMDRLICGDVGYGKTEVAMRAAFKVALDKKQVAVLVPTTILAQQHLNTFRERFRNYPLKIDMVNRFRTPREQTKILERLKKGDLDIVIGTHRLLSNDVTFADLGLVIIDEEQRFGVKHKEKLKKLRTSVDILTLTATPIPRTLHFSLMGVRDLSVIETPPTDRLAIKTFIRKFDEKIIREALVRELDRGGQIFFVHNKINSIHSIAEMIKRIVPGIRLGIGHGQLPEKQLETVMKQFIDKEIDLLLCTTIIESGLDIPSANTILVNRADHFGLAQLYQLRGRVGRYKHQAYAYFLIPGTMAISSDARKRLLAIEEMSELGAGFQLAARDMEIRGVGNMLGHNQSGHIATVGFDMYCKLIEESVKELKGVKTEARIEPEIELNVKGFIPKDYIPDLNQRLEVYRRLQLVDSLDERREIEGELQDRYGNIPEPTDKLLVLMDIRILCQKIHISKAFMVGAEARLTIESSTPVSPEKIAGLIDKRMRFLSEYQLGIRVDRTGWKNDLDTIRLCLLEIYESDAG